MINVGVSAGFHDAASTTLNGKEIIFANHCERYSQIKGCLLYTSDAADES